jgi:hypothetical protein
MREEPEPDAKRRENKMAATAEPETEKDSVQKFWHDNPNLPILFEKGGFRAYHDQNGDIFLEEIASSTTMRFRLHGSEPGHGIFFTTGQHIEALLVGYVQGWKITPNKER